MYRIYTDQNKIIKDPKPVFIFKVNNVVQYVLLCEITVYSLSVYNSDYLKCYKI